MLFGNTWKSFIQSIKRFFDWPKLSSLPEMLERNIWLSIIFAIIFVVAGIVGSVMRKNLAFFGVALFLSICLFISKISLAHSCLKGELCYLVCSCTDVETHRNLASKGSKCYTYTFSCMVPENDMKKIELVLNTKHTRPKYIKGNFYEMLFRKDMNGFDMNSFVMQRAIPQTGDGHAYDERYIASLQQSDQNSISDNKPSSLSEISDKEIYF